MSPFDQDHRDPGLQDTGRVERATYHDVASALAEPDFRLFFEKGPALVLILDSTFRIAAMTDAYERATLIKREDTVGRSVFEVFPDNPAHSGAEGVSSLRQSLLAVLKTRGPDRMGILKYDIRKPESGEYEERYWSPVNTPILGEDGYVRWIVNHVEDVTDLVLNKIDGETRKQLARAQEQMAAQLRDAHLEMAALAEENARLKARVAA